MRERKMDPKSMIVSHATPVTARQSFFSVGMGAAMLVVAGFALLLGIMRTLIPTGAVAPTESYLAFQTVVAIMSVAVAGALLATVLAMLIRGRMDRTDDVREGEARFRMIFEATPDAVFLIDTDGHIALANATSQRLFGYTHDELIGQPVEMLLPEHLRAAHIEHRECYAAHPIPRPMWALTDIRARCKDGTLIPVEVSLSPVQLNDRREMIAVVRDISVTVAIEELLSRDSQEFHAVVDNAPDVIARLDRDLRFRYANPAIETVTGRSPAECMGKTWGELGLQPEAAAEWQNGVREIFELGEAATIECGMDMAGAGLRHFHVRMLPERDLQDRITSVLVIARDITEVKRHQDQLRHQANHDMLTGLPNRILVLDRLQQTISHAQRSQQLIMLAYLDLDHFKDVNDTLGHAVGDDLLRQVAARIPDALRPGDTVGRHGGDEFIILLTDITHTQDVAHVAEKILGALALPFLVRGRELYVTCSMGLSVYPSDSEDAETLLCNADTAMYRAKEESGNTFRFYVKEMDTRMHARIEIEHDLRLGIECGELVLHFQPRVSLTSGVVLGFEALVRWNHPVKGLVSPDRFIGVAEDTGLIVPLGAWVLEEACRRARQWQDAGLPSLRMSVNLSARQFIEPGLADTVERVLAATRLDPACLELEITESAVMHDTQKAIETLRALKKLGVTLAVDDFGTGYSSLSYLKLFPIDVLKIDRSFVNDITTDPDDAAIVRAIVTLAHSLGLMAVAEGAEEAAQVAFLSHVGCDELQGYYFSRPLPEDAAEHLLRSGRRLDVGEFASDRHERTLLVVTDDPAARSVLAHALAGEECRIFYADSMSEALSTLATHGAQVVLCDQCMPGMTGIEFLSRIRQIYSETVCIIYSGKASRDDLADAMNQDAVFKALGKPWEDDELHGTIRDAFHAYALGAEIRGQRGMPMPSDKLACHDWA